MLSKKQDFIIKALHVLSWIIFIGVCIDAGGVLSNTVYAIFINEAITSRFWNYNDLSSLYSFDESLFVTLTTLMSIVTTLKAVLFYIIIKIFHDHKLDFTNPFNETLGKYIVNIAYCTLAIGLFSMWGSNVAEGLIGKDVKLPTLHQLKLGGADVWLFMGFVILIFAEIFKKGIEIQTDNDLTV